MKCVLPLALTAFALVAAVAGAEPARVNVTKTERAIEFTVGDELVARYVIAERIAKPYFWPLNAPGGVPVTRGWPMEKGCRTRRPTTFIRSPPGSATAT